MNGNDGAGVRSDGFLDPVGIQIQGVRLDIAEDRNRPHQKRRAGGGKKGVGRHNDFVSRTNAGCLQRDLERRRAGGASQAHRWLRNRRQRTDSNAATFDGTSDRIGVMVGLRPAPPAATVQHLKQRALLLLVEDGPGGESVVPYRRTAKKS